MRAYDPHSLRHGKQRARTMGNFTPIILYGRMPPRVDKPAEQISNMGKPMQWDVEITRIMTDFCISSEKITRVIDEVRASSNGTESNKILYQRAHRKFYGLILN